MSEAETTEITEEQIRHRAYEISQGPDAGTEEENWIRAEQELRSATNSSNGSSEAPGSEAPKRKPRARKTANAEAS
jgi:hypothetical protein